MDILRFEYDFGGLILDCEVQCAMKHDGTADLFDLVVHNFDIDGIYLRSEKQRRQSDGQGAMKYDAIITSSYFNELRGELDVSLSLKQNFFSLKKVLYDYAYDLLENGANEEI